MGGAIPCAPYHCVEWHYTVQYQKRGETDFLGAGAFGKIRTCTSISDHKTYCVKAIAKDSWFTRAKVMEEISILQAVSGKNPNIVSFVQYYEEWGVLNLVFEFCPKGNLEQAIRDKRMFSGSEDESAMLTYQILGALDFLKIVNVLHRDVKPPNLVFANEKTLKLADFGSACFCYDLIQECQGTPAYFAPEMVHDRRGKGYSFPVDTWALGICLYSMLFDGQNPFLSKEGHINKADQRSGNFQVGWTTSRAASDLLEWMLMPSPVQRITPTDALNHPWFASYGFGPGTLSKTKPRKMIIDSHGNWLYST